MKRVVLFLCALSLAAGLAAKNTRVGLPELNQAVKVAAAGDTITVASGEYRDVEIKLMAKGTQSKPVVIRAQQPGSVVVTGASSLRLAGEWIVVEGLVFRGGTPPSGSVIEFRNGREAANHCRITNCVIDSYNPKSRDIGYSYVLLYGRNNRFDHNALLNKLNIGVNLIVILEEERDQQNFHQIDHNYFGHRPVFGSNGAETIRVGTSVQALKPSNTVIEYNYFDRCDGEVEVISIKSCDNIIRHNYFNQSQGVLALRHGERNEACQNFFNGGGVRNTGGIRVINAEQNVHDNIFYRLAGDRFFSALAVMNAVPNSLPNRYCQVVNSDICNNTFVDCDHIGFGVGSDAERTLAPEDVRFKNNIIYNTKATAPYESFSSVAGFKFADNRVKLAAGATVPVGFTTSDFKFVKIAGIDIPYYGKPGEFKVVDKKDCGVSYAYNYAGKGERPLSGKIIPVAPGQDNLVTAVASAGEGDVIELTSIGEYPVSKSIEVGKKLVIRAAKGLPQRPVVRFNGDRSVAMLTLADGADLVVEGITFSCTAEPGKATAAAGISTAVTMIEPYLLVVDNCEFVDYPGGSNIPIRGLMNTFSEKIVIKNSVFRDISADAIFFAGERDDMGIYNVEELIVDNCRFDHILGVGINLYRGGSDESTAGPIAVINSCTFDDVCNKERGAALRLIGGQIMDITNCKFVNSGCGGAAIRLDEATWEKIRISGCTFDNSGRIVSMTGIVNQ